MCQHNQGGLTRHLFNHPSICKVCLFVFPFAPVETSIYSERGKTSNTQRCLNTTIRPTLYHEFASAHIESLMCHLHLQNKISLYHLPGITFPQHVACFNCRYAMALVLDSMLTFFTIQRKYDEKTRLVKHLGPAKCRTPKCKHRLATPPLAQCKCKNVCDKAVVGQARTFGTISPSNKTQCMFKTYKRSGGTRWHHLLLINCLKKQEFFGEPNSNYQVHTWHTNSYTPLIISSGTCSQVVCPTETALVPVCIRSMVLSMHGGYWQQLAHPVILRFLYSKFVRNILGKKNIDTHLVFWLPFVYPLKHTCNNAGTTEKEIRTPGGKIHASSVTKTAFSLVLLISTWWASLRAPFCCKRIHAIGHQKFCWPLVAPLKQTGTQSTSRKKHSYIPRWLRASLYAGASFAELTRQKHR